MLPITTERLVLRALRTDDLDAVHATEAGREMLRLGFESYGLRRMIGRLDGRNEPSARVLARLGMRREAHFVQNEFVKGEWADEVVYAMLHHEWHGGRR